MGLPNQAAGVASPSPSTRRRRLDVTPEKELIASAPKRARIDESLEMEVKVIADDMESALQEPTYPLIAREHECGELDGFLACCLGSKGKSNSLYLSGGPGTGKTCSARGAAQSWRKQRPGTRILEVNCMDLQQCSIAGLLSKLVEVCSPCKISTKSAVSSLTASVADALRGLGEDVILIIDEVDQLVKRPQRSSSGMGFALELLFGLPQHPKAPRLALIAIANAVDLLTRSVTPVAQRLCTSLLFEPYSTDQLRAIVKARFQAAGDHGVEAEKALGKRDIELRVRQVAKRSGDCRHMVRLCEEGFTEALRLEEGETSDAAGKENFPKPSRPASKAYDPLDDVKDLPIEQQVLLCALASGAAEASRFSEVFQGYKSLLLRLRQPLDGASKPQVMSALASLEQRGLLSLRKGKGGKAQGEQISELAVSRKALKDALTRANPTLQLSA